MATASLLRRVVMAQLANGDAPLVRPSVALVRPERVRRRTALQMLAPDLAAPIDGSVPQPTPPPSASAVRTVAVVTPARSR